MQVQVHADIQEHTHTPHKHITGNKWVGWNFLTVLWFVFFGKGRLVAALHTKELRPPTIII